MAEAAHAAAAAELPTRLLRAEEAGPQDLLAAGGYIFASPENLATVSGPMKDLFDRCYYPLLDCIEGRPYALMVCAGTDGQGAIRQMRRIVTGWRLREVAEPVLVLTGAQTPEAILAPKHLAEAQLAPCRELGAALAAGLAMGIF
ncbi:flavodoxin family protein [Roseococcus pinisoli]|uniref:NAD(P)H-dependent oxidoreductase n=1 Tax=Roseococcus pinisoli TaxID=2835040 RepID=A0ABS5QI33_9PROT|nr:NAD(P)H-dependent oxidoreductase [Roseococcus pinisoli]MBS7813345.1 NAD(P)H-dependent oxidoreductase [Roseococcus pinisoli]